jgi:hypothetical protein
MMTATLAQRYIVSDVDSGYPGVISPVAHLGSLLHLGGSPSSIF